MNDEQEPNGDGGAPNEPPAVDLAGYPDPNALAKGYRASSAEAQRLKAENELLRQQQVEFMTPRPQEQARPRPEDRLAELGIPVDALDELLSARVNQRVEQVLTPVVRAQEARSQMANENPEFLKFEAEVYQHLQNDPKLLTRYNNMLANDPLAAFEYAFLKFGEDKRRATPVETPQRESRKATEAAIPSTRQSDSRRSQGDTANDRVSKAYENLVKTGDAASVKEYAKARLSQIIPEDFLRQ